MGRAVTVQWMKAMKIVKIPVQVPVRRAGGDA
jgi:hypothetical protein